MKAKILKLQRNMFRRSIFEEEFNKNVFIYFLIFALKMDSKLYDKILEEKTS